jgi:hypothetical protein
MTPNKKLYTFPLCPPEIAAGDFRRECCESCRNDKRRQSLVGSSVVLSVKQTVENGRSGLGPGRHEALSPRIVGSPKELSA